MRLTIGEFLVFHRTHATVGKETDGEFVNNPLSVKNHFTIGLIGQVAHGFLIFKSLARPIWRGVPPDKDVVCSRVRVRRQRLLLSIGELLVCHGTRITTVGMEAHIVFVGLPPGMEIMIIQPRHNGGVVHTFTACFSREPAEKGIAGFGDFVIQITRVLIIVIDFECNRTRPIHVTAVEVERHLHLGRHPLAIKGEVFCDWLGEVK